MDPDNSTNNLSDLMEPGLLYGSQDFVSEFPGFFTFSRSYLTRHQKDTKRHQKNLVKSQLKELCIAVLNAASIIIFTAPK